MINALAVIALLLAAPGPEVTRQANFAENPSFEEDRNRDGLPDGWQPAAYESPARLAWDEKTAHSGKRSLSISGSKRPGATDWKQNTGRWVTARKRVVPGEEYTLEAWIKTDKVDGRATARIAWWSGGRWLAETSTPAASGTHDWQKVTLTAKAPPAADSASVYLGLSDSGGTAWFDDVVISGLAEPPGPRIEYQFTDTSGWYPFTFPLDDTNLDAIDLTGLLDAPAGKHGFLGVGKDGHFRFADGERARFFGTNVGGPSAFPEKEQARTIAARLAKYGVNLLRIHAIDGRWGRLIDYSKGDSRHFDPKALDRLDFFFAELKRRGIYVYFDMLDYRAFQPGDGVKDAEQLEHGWHHSIKGASCYNDRMIELQKEFAKEFFTHKNPYTGLRYCDDPAVAVVEITNENSVFYFQNTTLTLPCYVEELKSRWNRWLLQKHGNRAGLAKAWTNDDGLCALLAEEDPAKGTVVLPMKHLYQKPEEADFVGRRSPVRTNAMVRFFFDLQRRYYHQMRSHLKEIGIKVPITGTNQTFCPASNHADSVNDFMSRNNYWLHPNVHAKPLFIFRNDAMVRSDVPRTTNPIVEIASSSVAGKPMIVPEFNFPWPNEHRAEGLLLVTAYACLQDWDGLLFFSYRPDGKTLTWFCNQSDPVRWGEFPAAALMFHRRDVAAARNTVHVAYSEADVFTARPSHGRSAHSPYRFLPYLSKVRNCYFQDVCRSDADVVLATGKSAAASFDGPAKVIRLPEEPWRQWQYPQYAEQAAKLGLPGYGGLDPKPQECPSDTGQLCLDHGRGVFTIDAPRTKGAVGFLGQIGPVDLGALSIRSTTPFAAVVATSLDGKPLGPSSHVLITAVARSENTGQAFTPDKRRVPERGRLPVLAEPVRGEVRLACPAGAVVYALDETGKRRGRLPATYRDGALAWDPAKARSAWCEVVAEAPPARGQ